MRSAGRGVVCAAACAALVALAAATAPASEAGESERAAQAVVQATVDDVLAALRDESLSGEKKRRRIEEIAYERFDFETISRLVLARNWRRLSEAQRREFVEEFRQHLSLTYGNRLDEYESETVEVTGARLERNGDVTVRSRVRGPAIEPVNVDYRMRKRSRWAVIDVIIDGVSLIANFRTQTQELISQVGTEGLIERLREKNAEREAKG